jgi:UDP:flavonoid glycosyltransferase YjiC (YdhE family)
MTAKSRILFVSEAVSLAHVARPSELARTLPADQHELHYASNGQFAFCHEDLNWSRHHLQSIEPALVLARLASGKPVYSLEEWRQYVRDDMALLEAIKPDLVVGDFRLTLGVSARRVGIPYLAVCNAHWSPYRAPYRMSAPDLPISRFVGNALIDPVFRAVWPVASRLHIHAANTVRHEYGLTPYSTLQHLYCDGDYALYADTPALIPTPSAPSSHQHIGPIVWSPKMGVPEWWDVACRNAPPPIYITFGSTGQVDLLPTIVAACGAEGAASIVATAGRSTFRHDPPQVYAAPFLPGSAAAAASRLVICNGGSATAHQALTQGRPILGICSNLDQVLTMDTIAAAGAGEYVRASEATPARLRALLRKMLSSTSYAERAQQLQADFRIYDPRRLFPAAIERALADDTLPGHPPATTGGA